jgi:hypothetical protein
LEVSLAWCGFQLLAAGRIAETGKTRDIAAVRAGLGSGKTLEAAQRVVAHSGGAGIPRKNLFSACTEARKQKARSD